MQAADLHFPVEDELIESVVGVVAVPIGVLPEVLAQKVVPEKIHQGFFRYGGVNEGRAQFEAFHIGNQAAFRDPGRLPGSFILDFSKGYRTAGIEHEFEQFVAVVAKPPPVRFTVVYRMPGHAIDLEVMAQVLGGFQLELDDVGVVHNRVPSGWLFMELQIPFSMNRRQPNSIIRAGGIKVPMGIRFPIHLRKQITNFCSYNYYNNHNYLE